MQPVIYFSFGISLIRFWYFKIIVQNILYRIIYSMHARLLGLMCRFTDLELYVGSKSQKWILRKFEVLKLSGLTYFWQNEHLSKVWIFRNQRWKLRKKKSMFGEIYGRFSTSMQQLIFENRFCLNTTWIVDYELYSTYMFKMLSMLMIVVDESASKAI